MKNILVNKILGYSEKEADKFHNYVPRVHPRKGGYVWTIENNGFFHNGPDAADFWSANGTIYSVQKKFYLDDWTMHKELYQYSIDTNEFRISNPRFCESIVIHGEEWWYSEIDYPGKELGVPPFETFLQEPYNTINEYVDGITVLLRYCRKLHDRFNCFYPRKVKLGNRIIDSQGYFWKDIKYWNTDVSEFMDEHVGEVQKLINRLDQTGVQLGDDLVDKAKETWIKILTS